MKYDNSRSLCYNVAKKVGMSEDTLNQKFSGKRFKSLPEVKYGMIHAYDVIVSDEKKLVACISLQVRKGLKGEQVNDYMVAVLPYNQIGATKFVPSDIMNHSALASNACYTNKPEEVLVILEHMMAA